MCFRFAFFSAVFAASALAFVGCRSRETSVARGNRTGVLHVGNGAEVQTLDPHLAGGTIDHTVLSSLFEGLVTLDEETLQPRPGAAASWDLSADRLTYTFHLQENGRWSNGDRLTSADFLFSFQRALSPRLGSEYKDIYYPVKNAAAFARGELKDFSQVGFAAPNDTTLVVTLERPTPYFLTLLRQNCWYPVHRASVQKAGAFDERTAKWTRLEPFVSNGPFKLIEWRDHQHIRVAKNPQYWDNQHVHLNEIYFYPSESSQNQELAFRAGQLHTTWDVPLSKIDAYRKDSPALLRVEPYFESYFLRFNVKHVALKDVRVRRALAMAIDREAIVKNVTRGGQTAAYAFTPPGLAGYAPPAELPHDPAGARALLKEAGFPEGHGFPAIEILTISSEINQRIAEAIQQMWQRELGISVPIAQKEFKVYLDSIDNSVLDYTVARGRWIAEYPDALTFLNVFTSGNGINGTGFADSKYDAMVAAATLLSSPAERLAALKDAERYLLSQAPIAPIYAGARTTLVQTSVRNWKNSPLGFHNYKDVSLAP